MHIFAGSREAPSFISRRRKNSGKQFERETYWVICICSIIAYHCSSSVHGTSGGSSITSNLHSDTSSWWNPPSCAIQSPPHSESHSSFHWRISSWRFHRLPASDDGVSSQGPNRCLPDSGRCWSCQFSYHSEILDGVCFELKICFTWWPVNQSHLSLEMRVCEFKRPPMLVYFYKNLKILLLLTNNSRNTPCASPLEKPRNNHQQTKKKSYSLINELKSLLIIIPILRNWVRCYVFLSVRV